MGRGRQTNQWHPHHRQRNKCPPHKVVLKPSPQPRREKSGYKELAIDSDLISEWHQSAMFNPLEEETQRRLCRQLGLHFIKSNGCIKGETDVPLRAPRSMHRIQGDGNCLFHAFSYAITGSERQPLFQRRAIIHYMRTTEECMEAPCRSIDDCTRIDEESIWGSQTEMYDYFLVQYPG